MEKFYADFFKRICHSEKTVIYKKEISSMYTQFLFKECSVEKERAHRKKLAMIFKQVLQMVGFMEKSYHVLGGEGKQ